MSIRSALARLVRRQPDGRARPFAGARLDEQREARATGSWTRPGGPTDAGFVG